MPPCASVSTHLAAGAGQLSDPGEHDLDAGPVGQAGGQVQADRLGLAGAGVRVPRQANLSVARLFTQQQAQAVAAVEGIAPLSVADPPRSRAVMVGDFAPVQPQLGAAVVVQVKDVFALVKIQGRAELAHPVVAGQIATGRAGGPVHRQARPIQCLQTEAWAAAAVPPAGVARIVAGLPLLGARLRDGRAAAAGKQFKGGDLVVEEDLPAVEIVAFESLVIRVAAGRGARPVHVLVEPHRGPGRQV